VAPAERTGVAVVAERQQAQQRPHVEPPAHVGMVVSYIVYKYNKIND